MLPEETSFKSPLKENATEEKVQLLRFLPPSASTAVTGLKWTNVDTQVSLTAWRNDGQKEEEGERQLLSPHPPIVYFAHLAADVIALHNNIHRSDFSRTSHQIRTPAGLKIILMYFLLMMKKCFSHVS